jgi:hypothetical protein
MYNEYCWLALGALPSGIIMELPYRFPSEADKIFEEAQAFRRLSPTERFLQILELIDFGVTMLEQSPNREAAERVRQEQEDEWQRLQKEFLARHAS